MTTIAQLVARTKDLLTDVRLDTDPLPAWSVSEVAGQLDDAITHLARRGTWGVIYGVQAVAHRSLYPVNEQATLLAAGRATGGSVTTLSDSGANFVTAGVVVGDRLRNLTDGSSGLLTTVAATTLTVATGWMDGTDNTGTAGDLYVVERPLTSTMLAKIDTVLYNGSELDYADEERLDRRSSQRWDMWGMEPRYWTVDHTANPTVLRIVPPPRRSGSSIPVFPPAPLLLPWQDNLTIFGREQPQQVVDQDTPLAVTEVFEDMLVYDTAASLAIGEGEYQNLAVAAVCQELANLWRKQLEAR